MNNMIMGLNYLMLLVIQEYKELVLRPGESEDISFSAFTVRHTQCIRNEWFGGTWI